MAKRRKPAPKGIYLVVLALLCFVTMFLGMEWGMHRGTAAQSAASLRGADTALRDPAQERAAQMRIQVGAERPPTEEEPPASDEALVEGLVHGTPPISPTREPEGVARMDTFGMA